MCRPAGSAHIEDLGGPQGQLLAALEYIIVNYDNYLSA